MQMYLTWLAQKIEKAFWALLLLAYLLLMIFFLTYAILTVLDQVIHIGQVFPFVTQVVTWGKDRPFLLHKSVRFWTACLCAVGTLLFILWVALTGVRRRSWLRRYGVEVQATITRIGDNVLLNRSTYNGALSRLTYVEAKWREPESGRIHLFRKHIRNNARSRARYVPGGKISCLFRSS